jgi:hypothetical protein
MYALDRRFNDVRHTRVVRTHLTIEQAVAAAAAGDTIVEVPDDICHSNLECTSTSSLLQYIDALPQEVKVVV